MEYLIQEETLTAIGDAIRAKTGKSDLIAPGLIPDEINSIETGGEVDYSMEDGLVARDGTTYCNDRITSIGDYAFYGHSNLISISFPQAIAIGSSAFAYCSSLTTVSFPQVTTIGTSAFGHCYSLTTAIFPQVTTMSSYAFNWGSKLTTVSFPQATTIGNGAFGYCPKLTTVSFPQATTIGSGAFSSCSSLTTVSFPQATTIGNGAFGSCSKLTTVSFPQATTIGNGAFSRCSSLTTVSFPQVTTIDRSAFASCVRLVSLYLTGSSLCTLLYSAAFYNTPIGNYSIIAGSFGSIYVPASLLTTYQSATNWTYFSSRFVALNAEPAELITFTIDGTTYQAEEGMNWEEWCESGFADIDGDEGIGFFVDMGAVITPSYNVLGLNGTAVLPSDVILENTSYTYM